MSPDMEETEAGRQFQPGPDCCEDCDEELAARRAAANPTPKPSQRASGPPLELVARFRLWLSRAIRSARAAAAAQEEQVRRPDAW
jgi:hypothetical protein